MRSLLIVLCLLCAAAAVWALSEKSRRDLQVRDLRTELAAVQQLGRERLAARDRERTEARARATGLADELAKARARIDRVGGQLSASQDRLTRLTSEREAARQQAEALIAERDEARQRALATGRQVAIVALEKKTLEQHVSRLEADLQRELARHQAIDALIDKTAAQLRAERERHNAEILAARKFMPEGVRQALLALNECLHADGQTGLRFMRAGRIEDSVLHDVQLHDYDPRTLISKLYIAGELTFLLDRQAGSMTLLFKNGVCSATDGRREFPADGERLVLPDVDGRLWEKRVPYLVKASGDYPVSKAKTRKPTMRSTMRVAWAKRLNKLLQLAKTQTRYRIDTFRDLREGRFRDVLLVGYQGRRLASSVEAEAMWVYVDRRRSAVELRVDAGVMRGAGGEAVIPASGYRIQLPGVTPEQATDVMLGMVVSR